MRRGRPKKSYGIYSILLEMKRNHASQLAMQVMLNDSREYAKMTRKKWNRCLDAIYGGNRENQNAVIGWSPYDSYRDTV